MANAMRNTMIAGLAAGAFANASPATAAPNACPSPNKLTTVSPDCQNFLLQTLRGSVFDDVSDRLAVRTYQELSPDHLTVDGDLGPNTAKSILKGKGLQVTSPDPNSDHKELYVDKSKQVIYALRHGALQHVFSMSSGTNEHYTGPDGEPEVADTPVGTFFINSKMDAHYKSKLGSMPYAMFYDKKSFKTRQNIAVHIGTVSSNGSPLSHGCVHVERGTMLKYLYYNFNVNDVVKVVKQRRAN